MSSKYKNSLKVFLNHIKKDFNRPFVTHFIQTLECTSPRTGLEVCSVHFILHSKE